MKTLSMFTAGLLLVSASAMGQGTRQTVSYGAPHVATTSVYSEAYVQKAVNTYTQLLSSGNDGIVMSAIAHLTCIRIDMPDLAMNEIEAKIADLAESGRTPVIRYKAYLASMVFQSPEMFRVGDRVDSIESDPFFRNIAARAQTALLGQNSK